jgi:cytochrome b involved in lipid metabolism
MKKIFIGIILIAVLSGAYYFFTNTSKKPPQINQPVTQITPKDTKSTPISLEEIAKHDSATDCWFSIAGNVYDVTSFIASGNHPGGTAIISGCGKDATSLFTNRPKDNRPHSQKATDMLPKYQIGILTK